MSKRPSLLAIVGPTACGKTIRGVDCARAFSGEIISADSRQVYRGMDIGTGKDLEEYGDVPYHLIDVHPAGHRYNLFEYLRDANEAIENIRSKEKLPVVVGGTGMYVEALLNGLQLPQVPENKALREELSSKSLEELTEILASMKSLHNSTDVDTAKRAIRAIEIAKYYEEHPDEAKLTVPHKLSDTLVIGLDIPREQRRQRITRRLKSRLEEGMVDEVRKLLEAGVDAEDLIYYGLEYKFLTEYVVGRRSYDSMLKELEIAIHQFAKRQMTWFRGMERRGHHIHWLPFDMDKSEFIERVENLFDYVEKGN